MDDDELRKRVQRLVGLIEPLLNQSEEIDTALMMVNKALRAAAPAPKCPDYGEPLGVDEKGAIRNRYGRLLATPNVLDAPPCFDRVVACVNAMQGLDPEALGDVIGAWRNVQNEWGQPDSPVEWLLSNAFDRLTGEACPEPGQGGG